LSFKGVLNVAEQPASIAQLFDLPGTPGSPVARSEHVVRQEIYDGELYNDIVADSAVIKETVARGTELLATFNLFAQDAFLSLFKYEPELLPDDEVAPRVMVNKRLIDTFFESEDFHSLRSMTQLDALASALGTEVLAEKTIQQLEQKRDEKNRIPSGNLLLPVILPTTSLAKTNLPLPAMSLAIPPTMFPAKKNRLLPAILPMRTMLPNTQRVTLPKLLPVLARMPLVRLRKF
jgi:hypothetical protein